MSNTTSIVRWVIWQIHIWFWVEREREREGEGERKREEETRRLSSRLLWGFFCKTKRRIIA